MSIVQPDPIAPQGGQPVILPASRASSFAATFRILRRSATAVAAAAMLVLLVLLAITAPWIAPHNPFDLGSISLLEAKLPPAWQVDGNPSYLLGTDNQGRDVLSLILFGLRSSLIVGVGSIAVAMLIGVPMGLIAGYRGGVADAILMRVADVQLSFPAILVALLIGGLMHSVAANYRSDSLTLIALVTAIALAQWVMFARTARSLAQVEKEKEYVLAARIMGIGAPSVLLRHILPNIVSPITVLATVNIAAAILLEATLSFLGVGLPPTAPSLGTLIRIGNELIFSGMWWIAVFPGVTLIVLSVAVNLFGDELREVLNPRSESQ